MGGINCFPFPGREQDAGEQLNSGGETNSGPLPEAVGNSLEARVALSAQGLWCRDTRYLLKQHLQGHTLLGGRKGLHLPSSHSAVSCTVVSGLAWRKGVQQNSSVPALPWTKSV